MTTPLYFQVCSMEFEVKGKTDNWLQLKADGIGVDFVGKNHYNSGVFR